MRIAFFSDTFLPNTDGVVSGILSLRSELTRQGHEVIVFTSGSLADKRANADPNVFYFTGVPLPKYPQYKAALFPVRAITTAKMLGVEVVHSHGLATMGLAAIGASAFCDAPSVCTFHTNVAMATHYVTANPDLANSVGGVIWKYLQFYMAGFDERTCPSKFVQGVLMEKKIRTRVAPNGIDFVRFKRTKAASEFEFGGRTLILTLGRVGKEKNLDLLLRAAPLIKKEVKDALFVIGGRGPYLEEFQRKVAASPVSKDFRFLGFMKGDMLPSLYSRAGVFAFPSLFETQGLVALEALACGTPAVVAARSASADFVKDGMNGRLFEPNERDFAQKVVSALSGRKKLSRNARASILEYSKEKCARRFVGIYKGMLKK
jgi:glycosyltransferase involved in cell wall biosynthesis